MLLSAGQLPRHRHAINHTHSGKTNDATAAHDHDMAHTHTIPAAYPGVNNPEELLERLMNTHNKTQVRTSASRTRTGSEDVSHNHDVSLAFTGFSDSGDGTNNDTIDITNQHYKVIFIRKCRQE